MELEHAVYARRVFSHASVRTALLDGVMFGVMSALVFSAIIGWLIAKALGQSKLDIVWFGAKMSSVAGILMGAILSCLFTVILQLGEDGAEEAGMYVGVLAGLFSALLAIHPILKRAQRFDEIRLKKED